jgi:hypothetical protein
MQAKHKSREWLNTPGIAENNFHISYIHTKLVAESLLHIVRNFLQLFVRF